MKRLLNHMKQNIKSTVWKYYAFTFLRSFALFAGIIVPFFVEWGGLTLLQVQLLQAWYAFWVFVLEVPSGAVADKFGRKTSIILGSIVSGGAFIVYGLSTGFVPYLFLEMLLALGMALFSGADQALLYDALKDANREDESKKIIGRAHAFMLAGIGSASPIGGLLAGLYGLNAPVYLSAIPLFLAACIAFTIPEPKLHQRVSESKRYLQVMKKGLLFFYKHKTLRILAFDAIFVAASAYFVFWLYQPLLQRSGVPLFYFGFIHAFLVAVQIVIASNFQRLEKMFGSAKVLLRFSALATALGFFLVAIFPNIVTIFLFLIFAGGFGLTRMELMFAYMNRFIQSEQRATVLSSISMMRRLALLPMNIIIGFAAVSSLQLALLIAGILPLLVFLFSPVEQGMFEE